MSADLSSRQGDKSVRLRLLGVLAISVAIAAAPFALGNLALHLAVSGGLLALAAMPLTVLVGSAGLPSLGTAAFLCIGAFSAGIMANNLGLGLLPAVIASAVLGLLSGALVAATTLRVSGLYLAVGTLALQRAVGVIATDLDLKLTYAAGFMLDDPNLFGIRINSLERWWTLVAVLMFLVYAAFRNLQQSHVGREWALLRTHPAAAAAMGISITKSRIQVFALTSAIIAMVGVINAYHLGNVQAGTYTLELAIVYLTICALGKPGNLLGAITASYIIVLLPQIIQFLLGLFSVDATSRVAGLESIAIGSILILALLRVPQRVLEKLRLKSSRRG
ncbi:ABC branched chain amino acid family transporter, inner membrane subunit [Hyphomicrobium sp. MC1]|nr:ABC branched chain amino acid family transporter, inner membrane subunit [Hyphomicrobium sp. MC1]